MTGAPSSAPGRALALATVALLCLIWGTTWSVIQIGLRGIPPVGGVAIRFAIAAALLLVIARARRIPLGATRRERLLWLVNAVLAFSGSYGVVYWAEQWLPSGLTAVLFATYPLFLAPIAHLTLPGESMRRAEVVGVLVGFVGVAVIFSADFGALGGREVAIAAAVMLLSPLVSAISSAAVKRWGAGVHPISLTAVPMALTAVFMGALAALVEGDRGYDWTPAAVGSVLYLAVFGSAVTFTLYYWLLAHLPAKRLGLITYIIPVVAVLIGTARGEPFTLRTVAGSALVIAGVALATHRPRARLSRS